MDELNVQSEADVINQIMPGRTSESPFWHKIFYFDSIVLQNLICTAYDFLCLDTHCIAFHISYISASDLNWFPRFCKRYVIWIEVSVQNEAYDQSDKAWQHN